MNLLKEFYNATVVLIAIIAVMICIHWFFGFDLDWKNIKSILITNTLFSYAFYFGNLILSSALNKWMPWNPKPKKRAIYGTIITLVVNLGLTYLVVTLVSVFAYGGDGNYVFTANGRETVFSAFIVIILITLIFYSVGFFKEIQNEKLINEKLRKEKISAELNALKSQVNPHFLFNSFNVLSGLIDENPPQAQKFLSGLSKIYRYVLENRNENLVTLEKEIQFAEQFLNLQKIRFEDGINVSIELDPADLEKSIPALSLQLLLENAITHNGFDATSPINISISAADNILTVKNNKQERKKLAAGNGMGLKNIRDRYLLHKVEGFKIEDMEDSFIVHLPLITK